MVIHYCCHQASTTAYLRYGKTRTVVERQEHYVDGYGTCYSNSTVTEPDTTQVPRKTSRRFFTIHGRKLYLCPSCLKTRLLPTHFKTKGDVYAYLVTKELGHGT